MPPVILDHTLASLYASHGVTTLIVHDIYHNYTHIDIDPQVPRETLFAEDEDPADYGSTPAELERFTRWAFTFKTSRVIAMVGAADIVLYAPWNEKEHIDRGLAGFDKKDWPTIHYLDLRQPGIKERYAELSKGKKLAFIRAKEWMLDYDCVVDPQVLYNVNDKRYLSHPDIPTNDLQNLKLDDPSLRTRPAPFVVKLCRSASGWGVFLVTSEEKRQAMLESLKKFESRGGAEVQVSSFVESSEPTYCVNFFVGAAIGSEPRKVTFLGVNGQILSGDGTWLGGFIDYGAQVDFHAKFKDTIDIVARCLPDSYIGMVSLDVMIDSTGKQLVVDLNARLAGGIGSIFMGTHFKSRGFQFAEFTTFEFGGDAAAAYALLAEKVETGQIIIGLAVPITETANMLSLTMGGKDFEDLQTVRAWIKQQLPACEVRGQQQTMED